MNLTFIIILSSLASFMVSAVAIPIVVKICKQYKLYDLPNARKVHKNFIPRLGGTVFMPATMLGITIAVLYQNGDFGGEMVFHISSFLIMTGAFLIYLIGILDDIISMKANHKFMIQFVAASIFATCNLRVSNLEGFLGIYELPFIISWAFSVIIIMLIVNAMNLIDGIDGLSSGLTIIALSCFTLVFFDCEECFIICLLASSLLGAVFAFFLYNMFGKEGGNKVFMGDTGSLFIGYVMAYLALKNIIVYNGSPISPISLLTSFSLLFVPCIDLVRVAIERKCHRLSIFQPDKRHIHHILMATGLSMHTTLAVILSLAIAFILLNHTLNTLTFGVNTIILTDIVIYWLFTIIVKKNKKKQM